MRASIAWWDLSRSGQTIASLREHLRDEGVEPWKRVPGLRLKFWISDVHTDRWGAVMLWDSTADPAAPLPPNRASELIGYPPTHRMAVDVEAAVEGLHAGPLESPERGHGPRRPRAVGEERKGDRMSETDARTEGFGADRELRRRHREVVADYMSRKGENRLTRYLLFTEDGSAGLYTTDTGQPIVSQGHDKLKAHGEWSLKMFPDWEWINVEIFETQDPNRFWVECDGEGQIRYPDYPPGHYRNHFIHAFLLENGRIKQNREFMNPFQQLRALGIEVPKIKRGGIPT